ncbi:hypothetical protein ACFPRL_14280 [Pseudoclavibacter helvolus]
MVSVGDCFCSCFGWVGCAAGEASPFEVGVIRGDASRRARRGGLAREPHARRPRCGRRHPRAAHGPPADAACHGRDRDRRHARLPAERLRRGDRGDGGRWIHGRRLG